MDTPAKHASSNAERPSLMGSFFRSAGSGAFNSALMMGIFAAVGSLFFTNPVTLGTAGIAIVASSIFNGVIGVKKTIEANNATTTPQVNTRSQHAPSRARSQQVSASQEYAHELRTDWAERSGRSGGTQHRINDILDRGSMADKNRAQDLLAGREAETGTSASRF